MTTEVSVPACIAIRVLRPADVRLWCTNGEVARGLLTETRQRVWSSFHNLEYRVPRPFGCAQGRLLRLLQGQE